jgi:hypothetical protein
MTVGPLFWAYEQRRAQAAGLQHDAGVAMVEEVEAAVDPEALFVYGDVGLRVYWPVSRLGDGAADFWVDVGSHCFGGVDGWVGQRWG